MMKAQRFGWILAIALLAPSIGHAGVCDLLTVAVEGPERNTVVYKGSDDTWEQSPDAIKYMDALPTDEVAGGLTPTDIDEVLSALAKRVAVSPAFAEGRAHGPLLRHALLEQIASLSSNVPRAAPYAPLEWTSADLFVTNQWSSKQVSGERCNGRVYQANLSYFDREPPHTPVAFEIFRLDEDEENADAFFYLADEGQATEVRAVVKVVNALFEDFRLAAYQRTIERLDLFDTAWSNYLTKGYSQYPWESYLNSYRGINPYTWTKPPGHQWVFLHPEPSTIVDVRSTKGASLEAGLLLHGVGWIKYMGDERAWFIGASATGAITTSSELGLGGGGTLHFGHSAIHSRVPHISLSVLFHDTKSGRSGPFIGLSVDLWRLFNETSNEPRFRQILEKAKAVVD
jgi:hypothetical protein